jgi:hypothetical protein
MTKKLDILPHEAALACALDAFAAEERREHAEETAALFAAVLELRELPDGYALRLPAEPGVLGRVPAWSLRERRCCAFFRFRLEIEPGDGAAWLTITGPEGAKSVFAGGLEALSREREARPAETPGAAR